MQYYLMCIMRSTKPIEIIIVYRKQVEDTEFVSYADCCSLSVILSVRSVRTLTLV